MGFVLFAAAVLQAFGAATGCSSLAQLGVAWWAQAAACEADYARYRGTGESAEDLKPLTRAELEQQYRVEECDGLLWVYDRQTGELIFLFAKGPAPRQGRVHQAR